MEQLEEAVGVPRVADEISNDLLGGIRCKDRQEVSFAWQMMWYLEIIVIGYLVIFMAELLLLKFYFWRCRERTTDDVTDRASTYEQAS